MHKYGRVFIPKRHALSSHICYQKPERGADILTLEISRAVKSWHRMLDDGNDKKYCTTRKEFQFGKIEKKLQTCGTVAVLQREHIE